MMERGLDVAERPATTGSRLDELYVRHAPAARALAFLLTGRADAAEGLVHDAFVRLAGRFEHLRQPEAFPSYLRRTVVSLHLSPLRRLRREWRSLAGHGRGSGSDSTMPDVAAREDLWTALRDLPARRRTVLVLRFYEELPEAETADLLRCSVAAVRSLVSRGLRALRARRDRGTMTHLERDLERDLRTTLMAKGESVLLMPASPLPVGVRRRIRRRQALTMGSSALVVGVVMIAAVTVARTLPHLPPIRPVDRADPSMDIQRTMVASGVERGAQWRIFASWRPAEGQRCVEVETVASERQLATATCFRDPGSRPIAHVTAGAGAPFVYAGTVSAAVSEVTFESRSGRTGTARLLEVMPALDQRMRMFVAVVSEPGMAMFTARDAGGRVLLHYGSAPADA